MIFMFYQIMFAFSRMRDFPKVLDWNQGLVSNLFCVYQLSLQLVIWLVSWSFTVTGAKKPSTLLTKRWAHAQPFPTSLQWSALQPPPQTFFSHCCGVCYLFCTWYLLSLNVTYWKKQVVNCIFSHRRKKLYMQVHGCIRNFTLCCFLEKHVQDFFIDYKFNTELLERLM